MAPGKRYPVQIRALNKMGAGPPDEGTLVLDPEMVMASGAYDSPMMSYHNSVVGYTWLIALLGSLAFVLILISGVMCYYRKRHSGNLVQKTSSGGYLAANTTDTSDFHCQQLDGGGGGNTYKSQRLQEPGKPLWIDRRWNGGDYEKDSNSSEKKLLGGGGLTNERTNHGSDNEYAYIDRHNLTTFNNGFLRANSPEPYATTDILRQQHNVYPSSAVVSMKLVKFCPP